MELQIFKIFSVAEEVAIYPENYKCYKYYSKLVIQFID